MEERVFYESGDVKITNSRFVVGGQTYTMNGVTSVQALRSDPSKTGLIIGIVVGLLVLLAADGSGKLFGLVIAGICGFLLYQQKATHIVVLRSASGETNALTSTDQTYIGSVVGALNDAIVHRG